MNNSESNLTWGTVKENAADTIKHGRHPCGSNHKNHKLTEDDVRRMRLLHNTKTNAELSKIFGVHAVKVSMICNRRAWKHVA